MSINHNGEQCSIVGKSISVTGYNTKLSMDNNNSNNNNNNNGLSTLILFLVIGL